MWLYFSLQGVTDWSLILEAVRVGCERKFCYICSMWFAFQSGTEIQEMIIFLCSMWLIFQNYFSVFIQYQNRGTQISNKPTVFENYNIRTPLEFNFMLFLVRHFLFVVKFYLVRRNKEYLPYTQRYRIGHTILCCRGLLWNDVTIWMARLRHDPWPFGSKSW
jgi:hypothetical protein